MTTVVASLKHGLMVSDSRVTINDICLPMVKVLRIGGALFGFAGDVGQRDAWLAWRRDGGKKPKLDDFQALVLDHEALYWVGGDGMPTIVERGFHAIGTGGAAAAAAILAGKHPVDAVRIALQVDPNSGGAIRKYKTNRKTA